MKPPERFASPRQWMALYYMDNQSFLAGEAQDYQPPAWDRPASLVGAICTRPFKDSLSCLAAGDSHIAARFLARGKWILDQALAKFGNDQSRDPINLDRPRMALASLLGSVLATDLFGEPWPVPFDAFPRYIEADGRLLEEANAGRVLWALYAVFEGAGAEYEAARALKLRSHRDLRQEMVFVPALWELAQDPGHPRWAEYEAILARWLNPILRTTSYASNFQDMMAGLLALLWAKNRLGRLDRETVLGTYFGETLSVAVVVE